MGCQVTSEGSVDDFGSKRTPKRGGPDNRTHGNGVALFLADSLVRPHLRLAEDLIHKGVIPSGMVSFLTKLFGGGPVELAMGRGWTIHVMVEAAAWQDALRELKGWREKDYKVVATLVPEPGNRFDGKSVRVEIGGRMVGYLPRMLAGSYTLDTSGECIAKITKGFELQDGTRALGVCLNLAWPPRPGL